MAKRKYSNAYQDARGNWWADDGQGGKVAVDAPSQDWETGDTVSSRWNESGAVDNPYFGISQARLGEDAARWQPGQTLTPEEFQQFYGAMANPLALKDFGGMSPEQYLQDPRSIIRNEGGQYVYRPEMQQGEFQPVPAKHGFGQLIKGMLTDAPGMMMALGGVGGAMGASLGAAGMGAEAAGAGMAGTGAGALPESYWNMIAGNEGISGLGNFAPIAEGSGSFAPGLSSFSEFANPVLTSEMAGAAGANMLPMAATPSMGGYGGLEGLLGQAYGGANSSIPGIQNILQSGGAAAGQSPSWMQQIQNVLKMPVGSAVSKIMPGEWDWERGGQGSGPSIGQLLGTGLTTGLGYMSANKAADRSQEAVNRALGITEQEIAGRRPFTQAATNWLQNPSQFWSSDPMQEIAKQTSRVISGSRQENLFDSPTGQSLVMQSLAPQWLNAVTQMANLGLQNTAPLANVTGNLGLQAAQAQGMPGAVLGAGAADLFGVGSNSMQNTNNVLRNLMMSQQSGSGMRFG